MQRVIFIPSDYRTLPVTGWRDRGRFFPDLPLEQHDGFVIPIEPNQDTPTQPPTTGPDPWTAST